jgi:hypothetical protein
VIILKIVDKRFLTESAKNASVGTFLATFGGNIKIADTTTDTSETYADDGMKIGRYLISEPEKETRHRRYVRFCECRRNSRFQCPKGRKYLKTEVFRYFFKLATPK